MASESQKDETVINMVMSPLPSSYENLMGYELSMSSKFSIFQTPKILSRHNEAAYKPNAFSIGPFHYRANKQLEATQKIKLKYLRDLLSRSSNPEELYSQLIATIRSVQREARDCYAGSIESCVEEAFVEILVLDGCFISELFRKDAKKELRDPNDPIFTMSCLQKYLNHDLILLENQIPWIVLERLFSLTKLSPGKSLIELALKFFSNIFSSKQPSVQPNEFQDIEIKHILDLLRHSLLLPLSPDRFKGEPTGWEAFPCATKINEAGITFEKRMAGSILDINFKNGVLKIPPLLIQETTETILRNLISFEQCCPNYQPIVTSYAKLMDNLIDTDKDIEILSDKNIIDNWLNPEDAKQFFNKLYHDTYVKQFFYHDICVKVTGHSKRLWPRWRFSYVHNYFGKPWAIVSQVVGTILLVLTLLQTLYAVLSYVGDKSR
ncbi:UPF0481 protein At3g47200-like [Pistacia vera]|uniref:UPF0481 protein At3g47200-like n=1 Tax=Pistacia vera TaxID=55513 RepID=UPI001262E32A|nr:UPF0481 protein At3g47200-like [Pistacia vera]XP_031282232.1 UPF0481 protein At3g47200-like [Pistacia vera]